MNRSSTTPFSFTVRGILLFFLLGLVPAAVQLGILWGTRLPLGIPDEWTWARSGLGRGDLWNIGPVLLAGTALCGIVFWGAAICPTASPRKLAVWLIILWMGGVAWILSTIASVPGIGGLSRVPFVLFYTRSSGYFTQARTEARPLRPFLKGYRERIADNSQPENYLHLGTHPPGLTTALVGILSLCESSPALQKVVLATCPPSVRESFETIAPLTAFDPKPLRTADQAALWLAAVLIVVLAAGTCLPLFLLAQRTVSPPAAWWGAAFWLLVPAGAIFFPKSDVLFPCLAMWLQWTWIRGMERGRLRDGLLAGTLLFLSICLTLAFVPIAVILFLQALVKHGAASGRKNFSWKSLRVELGTAGMFGFWIVLADGIGGINLIEVWIQNLRNHAAFYQHATRHYVAWLLENPVELGFSLGLPLAGLSACGLVMICTGSKTLSASGQPFRQRIFHHANLLVAVGVWGLLWISGKNMGEAARLWVFLMPYAVWLAMPTIHYIIETDHFRRWLPAFFLIQMLVCVGTVLGVDGFQFADLGSP